MSRKQPMKIHNSMTCAVRSLLELDTPSKLRKISLEELADELGVKINNFYRWGDDPDGNSYARLTIDNLRKLMDLTGNYSVLDYFERRYGRVAIKVPKGMLSKNDEGDLIDEYRELTVNAVKVLLTFFKNPTKETKDAVDSVLEEVMKSTASLQRYADKKAAGQFEMDI